MLPKEMVLWERVAFFAGLGLLFATMLLPVDTTWQLVFFAAGCALAVVGAFRDTRRKLAVEGRVYAVELALPYAVMTVVFVAALLADSLTILTVGFVAVIGLMLWFSHRDIQRTVRRRDRDR